MGEQGDNAAADPARKLRLLVVMPRNRYVNATEEEFFEALSRQAQVSFHGPGYVAPDDLEPDLRRVYDAQGPFDAVLVHQYHYLDSIAAAARECVFRFDVRAFRRAHPKFPLGIEGLPCPVILFLLRMDYYALDADLTARIEAHDGHYLSWPAEFVPPRAQLADLERERFAGNVTDHYHLFAARNRYRLIPMMHVVGPRWFRHPTDGARPTPLSIPGQRYAGRIAASRSVGHGAAGGGGFDVVPWLSRGLKMLTGRGLHGSDRGLDMLQRRFRDVIAASRICYTDGSRLRWPVRKFFEIPALGAALVAEPFVNHEALGFRDGDTFLAATPETLPDVAEALLADEDRLMSMAVAGHEMVRRLHGAEVRAAQVASAIAAVAAGSYGGASWRDGEYAVERKPGAQAAAPRGDG